MEEEEAGSVAGNPGWFVFTRPRGLSHCVCTAGAVKSSALGHIGHMQPQLRAVDPPDPVICSRMGYDLLIPRIPQRGQHLQLPLEVLLVPAQPGVPGIPQDAVQGCSLSASYQHPSGPLLHQALSGI